MALHIPGYRIIRKINQGGMSTVFLAIQISVGRIVALKVMNPGLNADPAFSERFQREATIVGQLSHPNIVAIYDIGREEDLNYIAMDYLPGGSVHDRMINGLSTEEAVRVTKEIANALEHAHEKGYIHRDIKPENILFRADGSAVLSDFGVAKGGVGVSRMTHVGTIVGTPHYMSPEQARGKTVDSRSDLYSLGVVFFEMLTGTLPYQGDDAVAIALKHISAPTPKLPLQFQVYQKILDKLLAKDPDERFQSGREITAALEQLENTARTPYITSSTPENLSVKSLARALIAATLNAVRWRLRRLRNLRWSKDQGFYLQKNTQDSIYGYETAPTIFATRIQRATQLYPTLLPWQNSRLRMGMGALLIIVLWCAFSLTTQTVLKQQSDHWPPLVQSATRLTANLFITLPKPVQKNNTQVKVSVNTSSAQSSQSSSEMIMAESSQSVSSSSSAPPAPTFSLTVKTQPEGAHIKLLNIADKYKDGITLAAGRYHIEVSQPGYQTKAEWIDIKDQPITLTIKLETLPPEVTLDGKGLVVAGGKNAPELVLIPAGNFIMGDNNNMHTAPTHKVTLAKGFAMSRYEITFAEYDAYAQATNKPLPGDNGWGRDNRPVIHVSWEDARNYTKWLSKTTGHKYRLPTEAEWEYAARAGSNGRYWWGNNEQDARGKANCRRGCFSSFSGLFGSKTAPVGTYAPNGYGLYDMAGNVSEWVEDCYQDNYSGASVTGAAVTSTQCTGRVVRGGSTKDNIQRLSTTARDDIPAGFMGETLGFRVVMELN